MSTRAFRSSNVGLGSAFGDGMQGARYSTGELPVWRNVNGVAQSSGHGHAHKKSIKHVVGDVGDFAQGADMANGGEYKKEGGRIGAGSGQANEGILTNYVDPVMQRASQLGGMAIMGTFVASPALGLGDKLFRGFGILGPNVISRTFKGGQEALNWKLGETTAGRAAISAVSAPVRLIGDAAGMANVGQWMDKRGAALGERLGAAQAGFDYKLRGLAPHINDHTLAAPLRQELAGIHAHLSQHVGSWKLDELNKSIESANNLAVQSGRKDIRNQLRGHVKEATKLNALYRKAENWQNLPEAIRNAPHGMAETTVHSGVTNALFLGTTVTSSYLTARDLQSDVEAFRQLVADVTHTKVEDVGLNKMMFSQLPEPAASARTHLIATAGPRAVLEAVGAILNIRAILRGVGFFMAMLPTFVSQGIGMITGGGVLDSYKAMKANERAGQQNPPELYAQLLGSASQELYVRGGGDGKFAHKLGEIYAERGYTASEVLEAINSGQMMKDVEELDRQAKAMKEEMAAMPAGHSHVAALTQPKPRGPNYAAPKEVVGRFTEQHNKKMHLQTAPEAGASLGA